MIGLISLHDSWLAYQFDMMVSRLGIWVENMLAQRTKDGRPKYSLNGLLADTDKVFARQYRTDWDRFPVEVVTTEVA